MTDHPARTNIGTPRWARALFELLSCALFLGGCAALSAQRQKPQAMPASAAKSHEPLSGKGCADCHKQVVSSKVRCVLAQDQLCILCHEVPASGGPVRLVEASEPLCFKCHAKDAFKGDFIHGPFAAGACVACHDPHGGNIPGMLRVTGRTMCLTCHSDMNGRFANARFLHKAVAAGCTNCHSPHASEQRYQLTAAVPGLCAKCHDDKVGRRETAAVKHSPVTEAPACLNCHDPHMADEGQLLLSDELDICLKCHDKTVKADQRELANMKQLLAANPEHHGPIQYKRCAACHNPHGSPYFQLLTNEYPKDFYVPFFVSKYDLCFRCHDPALVKDERTTTRTGFRDGDRNLHFIHVSKSSNGRTCRSCHEVHASALPKHIAAAAPFGEWKLPIIFAKNENGGSCEPGCHAGQKYQWVN